jgi:hypothetical protein
MSPDEGRQFYESQQKFLHIASLGYEIGAECFDLALQFCRFELAAGPSPGLGSQTPFGCLASGKDFTQLRRSLEIEHLGVLEIAQAPNFALIVDRKAAFGCQRATGPIEFQETKTYAVDVLMAGLARRVGAMGRKSLPGAERRVETRRCVVDFRRRGRKVLAEQPLAHKYAAPHG